MSQDDWVQNSTRSDAGTALVSINNVIVRQNSSVAGAAACLSLDCVGCGSPLYYRLRALSMSTPFAFGEPPCIPQHNHLSFSAQPDAARCFCAHTSPKPLLPGTGVGLASPHFHKHSAIPGRRRVE